MDKAPAISGCKVELRGDRVVKSTEKETYFYRLSQQAEKQDFYRMLLSKRNIKVPEVYNRGEGFFEMEYLPYNNYIEFVEASSVYKVKSLLRIVLDYVDYSLETMRPKIGVIPSLFLVDIQLHEPNFPIQYSYLGELIDKVAPAGLPKGWCHGDLTFSNIMFSDDEIAYIDFNDTPLESPIFDIIKLRQDSRFHWTSFASSNEHDKAKVYVVDDWFQCELNTILLKRNINMLDYKYWEALNYLRIFRNTNGDIRLCKYLESIIKEIL